MMNAEVKGEGGSLELRIQALLRPLLQHLLQHSTFSLSALRHMQQGVSMMKRIAGSGIAVVVLGSLALAQPPGPPKPGAEQKALGYFVGKWKTEADMKASPFGPAGKMTSTDNCEWFTGNFQVVCKSDGKGPTGAMTSMGILSYDSNAKAYKYYGFDSMGMGDLATGTKSGGTWTFTSTIDMQGKKIHSRFTITEGGPTAYTFKWESSADGKTWASVLEGKSTKA
jgi:hypothetical protein